jgi:hypothetical protein
MPTPIEYLIPVVISNLASIVIILVSYVDTNKLQKGIFYNNQYRSINLFDVQFNGI